VRRRAVLAGDLSAVPLNGVWLAASLAAEREPAGHRPPPHPPHRTPVAAPDPRG